jgi:signal transduction histidine kinase
VTLRTKLSLLLCALLMLSIGLTGAVLIYESAEHDRTELFAKQRLFAETRAFALRDNFIILENELERLAASPQVDLTDENPRPEADLLESAHANSVLYNTAVLFVSPGGDCVGAVPDRPEFRNQKFADRSWFQEAKVRGNGPLLVASDEPLIGRTVKIIQPILRGKRFAGAVVGMIALGEENLITPSLRDNLPQPHTEAILVDARGRVIWPPDRYEATPSSDWAAAITQAVHGTSGAISGLADGVDSLFAFAPVHASTGYAVVFRWPWASLTVGLQHQEWALAGFLLIGIVVAVVVALLLSIYLTRPLESLGAAARRIARGEHPEPAQEDGRVARSDEIGALVQAFEHMEQSIRVRLEATQEKLVEAERFAAMGKTSAAIAHELKNTLNGLGMAVELILEDPANPRVARLRPQVVAEIARLRDTIDSLLSFSRTPRLSPTDEDLTRVVRRAVDAISDVVADRGAAVEVEAPAALPLRCDGHKIQGVVVNLVKNAAEAGRHVNVRVKRDDGHATVEVADDGPGLSEEARAHLFEPFFTTKPNGTGLGLPTSLRYVEAHGGTLEVAPSNGGALFRMRLPISDGGSDV